MGKKTASALSKCLLDANGELQRLTVLLSEVLSLRLELPSEPFTDVPSFKKFCSGLLERGGLHPWDAALSSCSPVVRSTVAASLFLFRKRLPSAPNPGLVRDYMDRLSSPAPTPDPDFLKFCGEEVKRLFKSGWDRRYVRKVTDATLSLSATTGNPRSKGGARFDDLAPFREDFVAAALGRDPIPFDPLVKVSAVEDGGKTRLVTIGDVWQGVLRPLHHLVYDHLSKKPWLLRGDAKVKSFEDFTSKTNEVFISGDYESATDNLSLELYEYLLKAVLDTTRWVPETVKEYAVKRARSIISDGTRQVQQQRGQLMGNLLSFPFLCLTNFLAFKYAVKRKSVPVRINGDDIVFRATVKEADRWMAMVNRSGLVLSKGKTLVDPVLFSLNSTFFRATPRRIRFVPFVRSKALFQIPESIDQLRGQYSALCPGFSGVRRSKIRSAFLGRPQVRRLIWRSERSLTRGLGMWVPRQLIKQLRLWDREEFYLLLPKEAPVPTAPSVRSSPLPEGWHRVDLCAPEWSMTLTRGYERRLRIAGRDVFDEMVNLAWDRSHGAQAAGDLRALWSDYWTKMRTFRYVPFRNDLLCRMLRLSPRGLGEYRSRFNPHRAEARPRASKLVWVRGKEEKVGGVWCEANRR